METKSHSLCNNKGKNVEGYEYQFVTVNHEPNSIVMLKKIKDVIPLLVIEPIFFLLKCSEEIKDRMNQEKI